LPPARRPETRRNKGQGGGGRRWRTGRSAPCRLGGDAGDAGFCPFFVEESDEVQTINNHPFFCFSVVADGQVKSGRGEKIQDAHIQFMYICW
jgi:hypothetical protein